MHCVETHAKMLSCKENLLTKLQDKLDSQTRATLTGMDFFCGSSFLCFVY